MDRTFEQRSRVIDRNRLSLVADGNTAGTGPGDPWTGSGGGVQPPYSGYAPSHLAQSTYSMHLPHDPMVSDSSSPLRRLSRVSLFLVSVPATLLPPRPFPAAELEEAIDHSFAGSSRESDAPETS